MNDSLHSELERLKERQAQLHHAVDLLGVHITAMEKRIAAQGQRPGSEIGAPLAVPPLLEKPESERWERGSIQQRTTNIEHSTQVGGQPVTGNLEPATVAQPLTPARSANSVCSLPTTPPPLPPAAYTPPPSVAFSAKPESFEMRLGTYWLVRIGIVVMLTALVFFGSYAYQNIVGKLGPLGKVSLLYLASGVLLGVGAWFQRRVVKESLRNYAQVLFAGGLAAVYFTTYAAHYFPNLKVITSPVLDGALLLGWAGFMTWLADRKKSETLALFSVGLAYYTSIITQVGHFTLYSNLVLAAATLFFLVRNRWAKLSFGSLIATYAGYAFWRFYQGGNWQWAEPGSGLWTGAYFLGAYWAVFTAAVFLSRHKEFSGVPRATFATVNNAAFFVLFLLTMLQVDSGGFWQFCLYYGAVLLGASLLAGRVLPDEPLAANNYLTQGLLLVTVGLIAKFSGLQLALLLGLESVVLWLTGTMRRNIVMRTSACVSAALAVLSAFDGIEANQAPGAWLGAGVGGLLVFNAFWSHWRGQGNSPRLFRVAPTYFSALALMIWTFALWQNMSATHFPAACAGMALVLGLSVRLTKLRELSLLGQLLLPPTTFLFALNQTSLSHPEPWWVFAVVAGAALALVHWWQKQIDVAVLRELQIGAQFVSGLCLVGATLFWLEPQLNVTQWVLVGSTLAVVLTVYGAGTRNWILALVAQIFAAVALLGLAHHAGTEALPWLPGLAPLLAVTLLALGGRRWADTCPPESVAAKPVRQMALWYGRITMAGLMGWTFCYVPAHELVWAFTALGAGAFAVAGGRKSSDFLVFAVVLNVGALASLAYLLSAGTAVYWPNYAAVLAWMIEQQIVRRQSERYPVPAQAHTVAIVGAGVAMWWLGSAWVRQGFSGFYLTASWSVFAFALFAAGVLLRERIYRWLGLGVLGAAMARVVIFDVWKLDTLYRMLSFFALGLVLLVVGFIYNKYQERLRQWL